MAEKDQHTQIGIASIILGSLGLIIYFIGWLFFSFVDNRLYGMLIGLILSILAVILGYIANKNGDSYGSYGMILGGLLIIITVVTVIFVTQAAIL